MSEEEARIRELHRDGCYSDKADSAIGELLAIITKLRQQLTSLKKDTTA
jgi:hypothetical protein